ncbi:pyridoxal phosphate-dependent transferase [Phaeosphaeriaceae sp. PMI808]|nr:pyridoxal phosphate-dependent transferase [Phaeosphaeriaceae sp. PMI808]
MAIPSAGMSTEEATGLIKSLLCEDLDPKLNLATFSTTTFDELPIDIVCDALRKNMSNKHEYGGVSRRRCSHILAALWHGGNNSEKPIGSATTGSSEAVMLGCLAMKKQWAMKRRKLGADTSCPNVVFSSIAHVVCAKFSQYFDVEARIVPATPESGYVMDPDTVVQFVDENTIGLVAVLGSTYTGHYESVKRISDVLDEIYSRTGIYVPIHVDAASGGLVAPFAQPELIWDFRLNRVQSINVSSHKFGQVPTSLGWIVWRDVTCIPQDLIFDVEYLDQAYQSWTLSFSKPCIQVVLQYYNFIRNGFDGTARIIRDCILRAQDLSLMLEKTQTFKCISSIHNYQEKEQPLCSAQSRSRGLTAGKASTFKEGNGTITEDRACLDSCGLPVVAFVFSNDFQSANSGARLEDLSGHLRQLGYSVPCCNIPLLAGSVSVLRIVVRPDVTNQIIGRLMKDIDHCIRESMSTIP